MRTTLLRSFSLFALLVLAAGCSDRPAPPLPYPSISAGCAAWQAGENFVLPREIRINANPPVMRDDGQVELSFAYFMPANTRANFSHGTFEATVPHGAAVARGVVTSVERAIPPVSQGKTFQLGKLPPTLFGEGVGDNVIYRIGVRFKTALPERFDLTPPPMSIDGKTYPVRTFTYRLFAERRTFGLCG